MNICIIGQYPPQVGGIATYTHQLSEKLKEEGHNVYILTYPQNCEREKNIFEAKTINIPLLRGISFIISSYRLLNQIIEKYDIDIIHANYLIPPGLIASLMHKKDVKIVVTAHGSDINILPSNKIIKPLIKYTLKYSDDVYFVSEKLEEKALTLNIPQLKEKSTLTPNTVNTKKFKPLPENERQLNKQYSNPLVIFIGNLVKQKGLTYLLEAKKIAKTKYDLLIYGEGPEKKILETYIKENKLENTYLMGKTTTPEKIIPEADIMVLPSISEGASIVALESMSSGKPLIVTNSGNISSIITNNENGIIVPIKNPSKLSQAIDELVENKEKREEIGKNARTLIIEKYSQMKIPYIE
ncbi:glycosyltransferase family 4 protein [Methanosphaera sp.]